MKIKSRENGTFVEDNEYKMLGELDEAMLQEGEKMTSLATVKLSRKICSKVI